MIWIIRSSLSLDYSRNMDTRASQATRPQGELLSGLKCFQTLPPETVRKFASVGVGVRLRSGESLWKRGDPSDFCAVVVSGWIDIQKESAPGHLTCQDVYGVGEVLGLFPLLRREPYSTDAQSMSDDTRVVRFYLRQLLD